MEGRCYGLSRVPLKLIYGSPDPGISEYDLTWRWRLYRDSQVQMRSLGWVLIQNDECSYKKRELRHSDMQRGETR